MESGRLTATAIGAFIDPWRDWLLYAKPPGVCRAPTGSSDTSAVSATEGHSANMESDAIDAANAMGAPSVNIISDVIDAANAMGVPSANMIGGDLVAENAMEARVANMTGYDPSVGTATTSSATSETVSRRVSVQPLGCNATCGPFTRTIRRP